MSYHFAQKIVNLGIGASVIALATGMAHRHIEENGFFEKPVKAEAVSQITKVTKDSEGLLTITSPDGTLRKMALPKRPAHEAQIPATQTTAPVSAPLKSTQTTQVSKAPVIQESGRQPQKSSGGLTMDEKGNRFFTVEGKKYKLSEDVYQAAVKTGLPLYGVLATFARESGLKADAVNPSSKACGLVQLMTDDRTGTLYEVVYNHAAAKGYGQYKALVKPKKDKPGFEPINAEAKATLKTLCLNADFNAKMYAAYTQPKVDRYERWLKDREITTGEFVLMNNLGVGGLQKFARQAWDDKASGVNTDAKAFFKTVYKGDFSSNKSLIQHPNGKPKTVRESYNDLFNHHVGGWGELRSMKVSTSITKAPNPRQLS